MNIFNYLIDTIKKRGAVFCVLIDPDKTPYQDLDGFVKKSKDLNVDAIFVGSSLLLNDSFDKMVQQIKSHSEIPVILFPGSPKQVSQFADAILFLSLISGRNPNFLFGDHVIAAPSIRENKIEPIATGYMLVESSSVSTTEFISNTRPIPRNKPDIAAAHALAAEYIGLKLIYLEAGSGAPQTVPDEMIRAVNQICSLPLIVGGGITTPDQARAKVAAGADIIVVGNSLENNWKDNLILEYAKAIHN
ncbi:geranylgeranylglyceryl/heptaprenylglyceryl phosphate synthase [candidate division KSB1 bacterium]|nr:geranylgeranylglyceryl/heptaprenylglyceryl phosphate synthase [candidate division KSB1 bacterium]